MIVSTSNIANQSVVTMEPASTLIPPSVVTDGDYSSVYTDALNGRLLITITFQSAINVGYVAIGGSNIGKKDSIKITASEVLNTQFLYTVDNFRVTSSEPYDLTVGSESTLDDSDLGFDESPVLMYKVDFVGAQRITIEVRGTGKIAISEIAIGDYYEIPRGEQSGYNRPWTTPNVSARSAVGLNNSPVNLTYESRSLSCTLTVPNNIMADFDGWYRFIKFAATNTFYILEDDDKTHSYACFNAVPAMTKSNSKTRKLGSSTIRFNAHAKASEALFNAQGL